MNDFAKGVIETLAWTRTILEKTGSTKAKQEIEKTLDMVLEAVAADFLVHIRV